MVNAPRKNLSPLLAGKYGKSTKKSTPWHHQVNFGNSRLDVEMVRALGALRRLRSTKKLSVQKQREMHIITNAVNEKWIEDYVDRETAVARKRV